MTDTRLPPQVWDLIRHSIVGYGYIHPSPFSNDNTYLRPPSLYTKFRVGPENHEYVRTRPMYKGLRIKGVVILPLS